MLFTLSIAFIRAGDMFLAFMAEKLHIDISFKNHSGIISCFVLRSIKLDRPVFKLKDIDAVVGCQSAIIKPSFKNLFSKNAIILECELRNAAILNSQKGVELNTEDQIPFLSGSGDLPLLIDALSNNVYSLMRATLVAHDDMIEFPAYEAHSEDVKIYASGWVKESEDINISIKALFSPEIAKRFPEELLALLTEEPGGWLSYSLHFEGGKTTPFVKFESDRFAFDFEEVEIK